MKKIFFSAIFLITCMFAFSQDSVVNEVQEGTGMRSNEKVYVVAAVLATVLAGLVIYLIRLDRKISKLEKNSS